MSHVTDLILIVGTDTDQAQAKSFSDALKKLDHPSVSLVQVDGFAGGEKSIQADIYMAAYNYLDLEAALAAFFSITWENRDRVQLLMKDEGEARFRLFVPEFQRPYWNENE